MSKFRFDLSLQLTLALGLAFGGIVRAAYAEDKEVSGVAAAVADSDTAQAENATSAPEKPEKPAAVEPPVQTFQWHYNYREAVTAARAEKRMLLVWFHSATPTQAETEWGVKNFTHPDIFARLRNYTAACLPIDATIAGDRGSGKVLQHSAFSEMRGSPGLAVIDYTDERSPVYGRVVSVYPVRGRMLSGFELTTLLDLPKGTLTQRTLTYAVRVHPESPASARGQADGYLMSEAESHSNHMASIRLQGHHNFDTRFQRMTARMAPGLAAKEVCAESWPGQGLLEAAEECVHSWRQSSGHWSAVSNYHPQFGYDMKLGSNGIWYGTGIFASASR